jgi:hypothetical protein
MKINFTQTVVRRPHLARVTYQCGSGESKRKKLTIRITFFHVHLVVIG